jgi:hypothetical protein
MTNRTEGNWDFACDSYGKVRHSKKACVYTTVRKPGGDQIVKVAARVENWTDARLLAAAPAMLAALERIANAVEINAKDMDVVLAAIAKAKGPVTVL